MGDAELHEQALFNQHQRELREARAKGSCEGAERAVEALIGLDREGLWDEDTITRAIDAIRTAAREQS